MKAVDLGDILQVLAKIEVWADARPRWLAESPFAASHFPEVDASWRSRIAATVHPRSFGEMDAVRQCPAISRRTRLAGVRTFSSFGV